MSIEHASSFFIRVSTDEKFRTQLEQIARRKKRQQIIKAAGYEFTIEEWKIVKEEFLAVSDPNEAELSDAELSLITGGYMSPYERRLESVDKLL